MLLKFLKCSFLLKTNNIQKFFRYIAYEEIACLLWVLRYQIENGDIISLSLLIILFMFIAEGASGLLMYSSVKVFITPIVISEGLVLTQNTLLRKMLEIYGETYMEHIIQFLDYDKIVFYDFPDYWCVACKFNKILALDSIRVLEVFHRNT